MKGFLLWGVFMLSTVTLYSQRWHKLSFEHPQMGTLFKITVYAQDTQKVTNTVQKAFQRIDALNLVFSDYTPQSEISQLTVNYPVNQWLNISKDLHQVLRFSQKTSRKSKGVFDVTIGPLSKLWRRAFRRKSFPDSDKIEAALKRVNYKCLQIHPRKSLVKFKCESIQFDFGAIAKGYSVDKVAELLIQQNFRHFLIDGGGDLYAGIAPPGQTGWRIQLPNQDTMQIQNQAIATSGDQFKFLEWQGKRYSHIIHPKTGLGIQQPKTISVLAPTCMESDVWASILSIHYAQPKSPLNIPNHFQVFTFQND